MFVYSVKLILFLFLKFSFSLFCWILAMWQEISSCGRKIIFHPHILLCDIWHWWKAMILKSFPGRSEDFMSSRMLLCPYKSHPVPVYKLVVLIQVEISYEIQILLLPIGVLAPLLHMLDGSLSPLPKPINTALIVATMLAWLQGSASTPLQPK